MINFEEIAQLLSDKFGPDVIVERQIGILQPALVIRPDKIVPVCEELRDNEATWMDFLSCLTGVDHGPDDPKFSVVYHLASIPHQHQLVLKVIIEHDRHLETLPSFQTVSGVWKTAEWHEREAFDLLGIHFEGHPDERRILLPDDWEGFPLRKDYQAAEEYKGIKIN
jgi:NADH-quinone oxidoreductase subunit C